MINNVNRFKAISLVFIMLLGLSAVLNASDSGTFRGKWWNYYERGLESAERGDHAAALSDLREAVSLRGKDQRNARTYGMHFVDYFPHREIGVVLLGQGDLVNAAKELEESVKSEDSAKASYYLNKLKQQDLDKSPSPFRLKNWSPEYAPCYAEAAKYRGKRKSVWVI